MHVPPFLQGELWHSLISKAQRGPVKPGRQLQWKEFIPSVQEPPLRHGSVGTKRRGELWSSTVNVHAPGSKFDSNSNTVH